MNSQQEKRRIYENIFAPIQDRTDRFQIDDDGIYYKTREGAYRGPFSSQKVADFDLEHFIQMAVLES